MELERRDAMYRGGRALPPVRGHVVILIDDGLATGSTMQAAVTALRRLEPARIVVAVPVGAPDTCTRMRQFADEVVCVAMPEPFQAVGLWYEQFTQTTDEEVKRLLAGPGEPISPFFLLRERALRLRGDVNDYDALLAGIGDARIVMIGEASHGTHEFYRERALITRRLISEKGFTAVAVEADWPDASREPLRPWVRFRRGCRRGAGQLRALPHLDVAQRRRPRFCRLAPFAQRHAGGRPPGRLLRPRSVQPSHVD
jgi:hypothetical protein